MHNAIKVATERDDRRESNHDVSFMSFGVLLHENYFYHAMSGVPDASIYRNGVHMLIVSIASGCPFCYGLVCHDD